MTENPLLPLTNDPVFKMFFKEDKDTQLLISLLSHFLPLPEDSTIISVDILDPERLPENLSMEKEERGKSYVLDLNILVKLQRTDPLSGKTILEIVNVEVQTSLKEYMVRRILSYGCRTYSEQLKKGQSYATLCRFYSLLFTTENMREFQRTSKFDHVCVITARGRRLN